MPLRDSIAGRAARRGVAIARRPLRVVRLRLAPSGDLRDSWRSSDVARQMLELTDRQLVDPEAVPPYRAFVELLPAVLDDPLLPQPATFLDMGCGVGAYGELLARVAPGRFDYVGADYSAEILEVARRRWPDRRFEERDVFAPGALNGFDVVFASALLDVLVDAAPALDVLLACDAPWIILHRQRIDARRPRVEVAPGYKGQQTYSSYLSPRQLADAADRHGRRIAAKVAVEADIRSFVLTRS